MVVFLQIILLFIVFEVIIKKPEHVHKGSTRYTAPCLVIRRIGPNTFLLEDGKKYNASRLMGVQMRYC